jgi:hypothetical protein
VFTAEERERVRDRVLELARADERVVGAAVTGSAALDRTDRWSDVDLFFGVADGIAVADVVADWSDWIYRELAAIHHFELFRADAVYRAFLLPSSLELDIGIASAGGFGASTPQFRLVFGETVEQELATTAPADLLIGFGWHHVLHARAAIERGQRWRAEYWISAARHYALELACLRLGKPTVYGRGFDLLPEAVTAPLEDALVRTLDEPEFRRALASLAEALLREIRELDPDLATRLEPPFREAVGG